MTSPTQSTGSRIDQYNLSYRLDLKMVTLGDPTTPWAIQGKNTAVWTFQTLEYADLLLERGRPEDVSRAAEVLEAFFARQVMDPPSRRGGVPIQPDNPNIDPNSNVFLVPALIKIDRRADRLPNATRRCVTEGVRLAVDRAEHRWDEDLFDLHRDNMGYSNIYALYAQALVLAARHYKEERLIKKSHGQWRRWFNHVAYYGIDEFCSPTYNFVDYEALTGIYDAAGDEAMRFQSAQMLEYLCALQYGICHPLLKMPVCGCSRDYHYYLYPGYGLPQTIGQHVETSYVKPAAVLQEYENRKYPHLVRGRAGRTPFRFQSWQERHYAMGSMTGGNYAWQQVHCSVAVGEDENRRAIAMLPGNNSRVNGYVAQQDNTALCLFNRLPSSYMWTQHALRDAEIQDKMREWKIHACSIGLTDTWRIEESPEGIIARAFGHTLTLRPFVIDNGRITAAQLAPWPAGQPHHGMQGNIFPFEGVFPEDAMWFGCHVAIDAGQAPRPLPQLRFEQSDRRIRLASADGLSVQLFESPTGETIELYEDDWRTAPLLQAPTGTLWPGEMARRSANR